MKDFARIVFVSEMRNPYKNASSTQIMTYNLLYGFYQLGVELIFVPIIENDADQNDIIKYYSDVCDKVVFTDQITNRRDKRIGGMISALYQLLFDHKRITEDIEGAINEKTILVSHSPSIDAVLFCRRIKRVFPMIRYVQYWSDPLALSLITPDEFTFKRSIWRFIERQLYKYSNSIAIGTRSLYEAQCVVFPELKEKGYHVRVGFNPRAKDKEMSWESLVFGYYGNYFSNIRSIRPLYDAFKKCRERLIICGAGDVNLDSTDNITIQKRIPQAEVLEQEKSIDVEICILNKIGIQIPGKVFYQTNTHRIILVILDGPNREKIKEELKESGRFVFCNNKEDDIIRAVDSIKSQSESTMYNYSFYDPVSAVKEILKIQ